jgi:hypothetical protein
MYSMYSIIEVYIALPYMVFTRYIVLKAPKPYTLYTYTLYTAYKPVTQLCTTIQNLTELCDVAHKLTPK